MRFLTLAALLWGCQPTDDPTDTQTPASDDPLAAFMGGDGNLHLFNQARHLDAAFTAEGVVFSPGEGGTYSVGMLNPSLGRAGNLTPVQSVAPTANGRDVTFSSEEISTWYRHSDIGIEQGFDLDTRPAGDGELQVQVPLALDGLRAIPFLDGIRLVDDNEMTRLSFTHLSVLDADGDPVEATLTLDCEGSCLTYRIDDSEADYPLTIDPVLLSQELHYVPTAPADVGDLVAAAGNRSVLYDSASSELLVFSRPTGGPWALDTALASTSGVVDLDLSFNGVSYFLVTGIPGGPEVRIDTGAGWGAPIVFSPVSAPSMTATYGDKVAADDDLIAIGDSMSGRIQVMHMPPAPATLPLADSFNYAFADPLPPAAVYINEMDVESIAEFTYITSSTGAQAWTTTPGLNQPPALAAPVAAYTGHLDAAENLVVFDNATGGTDVQSPGAGIADVPLFIDPLGTGGILAQPGGGAPLRMYTKTNGADSVRVFEDDTISGAGFKLDQTLTPDVPVPGNGFGTNMAAAGDGLVVGAPTEGSTGAAYFYEVTVGTAPLFVNSLFSVDEGAVEVIQDTEIGCLDFDPVDVPANLVFSFDAPPVGGTLQLNGVDLGILGTFTQQDTIDGLVQWADGGGEPGAPTRTLDLTCTDSFGLSDSASVTINVNALNDVPVIDVAGSLGAWTEGLVRVPDPQPVDIIDGAATVSDGDDNIASLTLTPTAGFQAGDLLAATASGGVTVSFDSGTGALTLTGPAAPSAFETVLRTVSFDHTTDDPDTTTRTFELVATDVFGDPSAPVSVDVSITADNDPPEVTPNTGTTMARSETHVVLTTEYFANDPDNVDADITFTVNSIGTGLTLRNGATVLSASSTFSVTDITAGNISIETGDLAAIPAPVTSLDISFTVSDPAENGTPDPSIFTVTIDPNTGIGNVNPGDLVITEALVNPAGAEGANEWFEIYNTTTQPIDLDGLVVRDDGGQTFTVSGTTILAAGAYGVFAEADGPLSGITLFDPPGTWGLGNGFDEIELFNGTAVIDRVAWDNGATFPDTEGRAINFDGSLTVGIPTPDTTNNANGAYWCNAWSTNFTGAEYGTPALVNDDCQSTDFDGDGFVDEAFGGDDCDDNVAAINPMATEVPGNGIDENCDDIDGDAGIEDLNAGDLRITEIHAFPSTGIPAEWVEIQNVSGLTIDLVGLELRNDHAETATISSFTVVAPGEYFLMANRAANAGLNGNLPTGGTVVDYANGFDIQNNDDLQLVAPQTGGDLVVDELDFDATSFFLFQGATLMLDPFHTGAFNADAARWCDSFVAWSGADFGSPGAANPTCTRDIDGDGFNDEAYDGANPDVSDDCDDDDFDINPNATEIPGNGIDENCDDLDADLGINSLVAGDLVITEIMKIPRSPLTQGNGEWFEVLVNAAGPVDLIGLELLDDDVDSEIIDANLVVNTGDYVVFGANGNITVNGGVAVDHDYNRGDFILNNGVDELVIRAGTTEIDRVDLDDGATFPDPTGASISLDPAFETAADNDAGINWCDGRSVMGTAPNQQFGTPGAVNDVCEQSFDFDFEYTDDVGQIFVGATTNVMLDGTGIPARTGLFTTGNAGNGDYHISTSNAGQFLTWTYVYDPASPAITYELTRPFGQALWCGGTMTGPLLPTGWSGTWDQVGCP